MQYNRRIRPSRQARLLRGRSRAILRADHLNVRPNRLSSTIIQLIRESLDADEASGFRILRAIPSSESKRFLRSYAKLSQSERDDFKDAASVMGAKWFGVIVDPARDSLALKHWKAFCDAVSAERSWEDLGVRGLRTLRGMRDAKLTEADFSQLPAEALAKFETIESAKAPDLKKAAKPIFAERLKARVERAGGRYAYIGQFGGNEIVVKIDYSSPKTQLWYDAQFPGLLEKRLGFNYESVFGFGGGTWNFIEAGHEDEAMSTLVDAVQRLAELVLANSRAR